MPIRRERNRSKPSKSAASISKVATLPTLMAMRNCFERYLNLTIAEGNASQDTIKTYRNRAVQFLNWCQSQELYPALVTKTNVLEYRKHLINSSNTSSTIRLSLTVIKHFYTACSQEHLVKDNPAMGVKAPKEKRELGSTANYLSEPQLQQIFDNVAPAYKIRGDKAVLVQVLRDRLLLGCMALQGCRTIEVHRANFGDIYQSDECFQLRLNGKNSIRTAILRPDLAAEIVKYQKALKELGIKPAKSSPLFVSLSNRHYGQRISRRGIAFIVDGYLNKCGLKYSDLERSISAHSLRHTAGTLSLHNGSSLPEVQEFLGHNDPKTTVIYTHNFSAIANNPANKIEINLEPKLETSTYQSD